MDEKKTHKGPACSNASARSRLVIIDIDLKFRGRREGRGSIGGQIDTFFTDATSVARQGFWVAHFVLDDVFTLNVPCFRKCEIILISFFIGECCG